MAALLAPIRKHGLMKDGNMSISNKNCYEMALKMLRDNEIHRNKEKTFYNSYSLQDVGSVITFD